MSVGSQSAKRQSAESEDARIARIISAIHTTNMPTLQTILIEVPFSNNISYTEDDCCCGFTVMMQNAEKTHRVKFMRDWGVMSSDGITWCLLAGPVWCAYACCECVRQKCMDSPNSTHQIERILDTQIISRIEPIDGGLNIYMKENYNTLMQDVYQIRPTAAPQAQNMN
jgi:hypothetical protein